MDVAARVERCFGPGVGDREARTAVLAVLAERVGFDAHVFAVTDPASRVVSSPHATLPGDLAADLPLVIRRRYVGPEPEFRAWLGSRGVADNSAPGVTTGQSASVPRAPPAPATAPIK